MGSLINLGSLGDRQRHMLIYLVKGKRMTEGSNRELTFIVTSERSPKFCKSKPPGFTPIGPSLVPMAEWLCFSHKRKRFSCMAPDELMNMMGMNREDFFPNDSWESILAQGWTYWDVVVLAGNAYHMRSAGCCHVATLMHSRLKHLGTRNS